MEKSCLLFVFLMIVSALAVPLSEDTHDKTLARSQRDLAGVFESIGNSFSGLISGARTVTDSIRSAFNKVFSNDNKNAITDGFERFSKGVKGAWGGLFGSDGEIVKGFKKVGNKIKGAWSGSEEGQTEGEKKSDAPAGEVPQGETT